MDPQFIKLCAEYTDLELLNALEGAIDDHYGFDEFLKSWVGSFPERLFWVPWKSQSYMCNEGLEQFLGLAGDRGFLAESLDHFGFKEEARFLTRFLLHLPDRCAYVECQEVERILGILFDSEEAFERMETQFFSISDDLYKKLSFYVRTHLSCFEHLPIQPPEPYATPAIGYLPSFRLWISLFAAKNDDRIPTFAELQRFVGKKHPGIASATADEYDIVQSGCLSTLARDAVLIKYNRPIFGHHYAIRTDERIVSSQE